MLQARKQDAEKKRQEALEKKRERDALLAEESAQDTAALAKKGNVVKKTQMQIREETQRREMIARGQKEASEPETHLSKPLEENVNRLQVEEESARTVEEAISVLK